jgi:hypothetical protein
VDIQYIHQDDRGAIVAVESQTTANVVWEAAVSPQGQTLYIGLPGPSGRIGNTDELPAQANVEAGVGGALPDGELGSWAITDGGLTADAGRSMTLTSNVLNGGSPYLGIGATNPGGGPIPTYNPNGGFDLDVTFNWNGVSDGAKLAKDVGTFLTFATSGLKALAPEAFLFNALPYVFGTIGATGAGVEMYQATTLHIQLPSTPSIFGVCARADCFYGAAVGDYDGMKAGILYPDSAPTVISFMLGSPNTSSLNSPGGTPYSGQGGTQIQIPASWGTPSGGVGPSSVSGWTSGDIAGPITPTFHAYFDIDLNGVETDTGLPDSSAPSEDDDDY